METITLPIYNTDGKQVDKIELDRTIFDGKVNTACIHQAVVAFSANQRRGLAATKTRGEVSGGGKKPWRQKGTGRAMVGSIRSPLWRHGGVIFGPHPRDYSYSLPWKIRNLALRSGLNAKIKIDDFIVLDEFKLAAPKTKEAIKVFFNLRLLSKRSKKIPLLLLLDKIEPSLKLALRNISFLNFNLARNTHVYEVLAHKKVLITKAGLTEVTDRLKK